MIKIEFNFKTSPEVFNGKADTQFGNNGRVDIPIPKCYKLTHQNQIKSFDGFHYYPMHLLLDSMEFSSKLIYIFRYTSIEYQF